MTAAAAAATKTDDDVTKEKKTNRFKKAAIKTLTKIRSFYRRSVSECAGQMAGVYGGDGGHPPHLSYSCPDSLPRSYSTVSSTSSSNYDDDYRHLIRAASANSVISAKKIEPGIDYRAKVIGGVGRSQSVGVPVIGRIDEEEATEFEDDVNLKLDFNPKNGIAHMARRRVQY